MWCLVGHTHSNIEMYATEYIQNGILLSVADQVILKRAGVDPGLQKGGCGVILHLFI